jgi:signal peptidase I
MEPAYSHKEWVIIEKRSSLGKDWTPDKYDVVIVNDEKENLCKRIIGLPGDTIEIKEGFIYLNEKKIEEYDGFGTGKIFYFLTDDDDKLLKYWNGPDSGEPVTKDVNDGKKTIPERHVWVIGDNRSHSWYGILPIKLIRGVVIF